MNYKKYLYYGAHGLKLTRKKFDKLDEEVKLELIAFYSITGGDIEDILEGINPKLAKRYTKLMYNF